MQGQEGWQCHSRICWGKAWHLPLRLRPSPGVHVQGDLHSHSRPWRLPSRPSAPACPAYPLIVHLHRCWPNHNTCKASKLLPGYSCHGHSPKHDRLVQKACCHDICVGSTRLCTAHVLFSSTTYVAHGRLPFVSIHDCKHPAIVQVLRQPQCMFRIAFCQSCAHGTLTHRTAAQVSSQPCRMF